VTEEFKVLLIENQRIIDDFLTITQEADDRITIGMKCVIAQFLSDMRNEFIRIFPIIEAKQLDTFQFIDLQIKVLRGCITALEQTKINLLPKDKDMLQ
jgi:hypothetical protein